jgi:hypothetical protein
MEDGEIIKRLCAKQESNFELLYSLYVSKEPDKIIGSWNHKLPVEVVQSRVKQLLDENNAYEIRIEKHLYLKDEIVDAHRLRLLIMMLESQPTLAQSLSTK